LLIIFDLDDTLIDTSGCVTPGLLAAALQKLMQGKQTAEDGLLLQQINAEALRTQDALRTFSQHKQIDKTVCEQVVANLNSLVPTDYEVHCTPHAKEILAYFAARGPIALVTGGHPPFQLEKLKKAGIQASLFSKIGIPEDSVKKPFYSRFAAECGVPLQETWVCGDRIWMDLQPAHELGCKTVHMRWGRGKQMAKEPWVNHTIGTLPELKDIIR